MRQARLEVVDATGQCTSYPIDKDEFRIGRKSDNDLTLQGPDVSRVHAVIVREGDQFVLSDTHSRFGTFVNDAKVERRQLCHDDRIRLGPKSDVSVIFLCDDADRTTDATASIAVAELRNAGRLLKGLRQVGAGGVVEEALALVLDLAIEVGVAERGFVMLASGGDLEITVARARGRVSIPGRTFETSRRIPEEVFRSGETQAVQDLRALATEHKRTTVLQQVRYVFCAPLRLVRWVEADVAPEEQRRIGVLYLDSRRPCAVSADARTALELLAGEAAVVIEHARLYRETIEKARLEHEMKIAAKIQQSLLPPGNWTGAYFEAMGTTLPCRAIGGDFFDYMALPSGEAGFAVADVAGKGAPAALLTAVIQGILAAHTSITGGPAEILTRTNRALVRRAVESRFATLLYGVLSPDGQFAYCNAGHNAPFLLGRSGVRRLETGGTILGLFETASYEEETVRLEPGDLVVAFTDGLSEAMSAAGEQFGDERILECLKANASASPPRLMECLLAEVHEFLQDAVQNDDVTILIVRYLGKPGQSQ